MCIIVSKPSGVEFPSLEIMKNCFTRNHDGAGYMYPTVNGLVYHKKGIMTWEDFETAYKFLVSTIKPVTPMVFHFRIRTHGNKGPTMTHPFEVSEEDDKIKSIEGESEYAFAHNGVLSFIGRDNDLSDTALYVKKILAPLVGATKNKDARDKIINATIESCRFVLMDGMGEVTRYGTWETEGGVFYSNAGFRTYTAPTQAAPFTRTYPGYGGYGGYDADDYAWGYRAGHFNKGKKEEKKKEPEEVSYKWNNLMKKLTKPVTADGIEWAPDDFDDLLFVHAGEELCCYDSLSASYFVICQLDTFAQNLLKEEKREEKPKELALATTPESHIRWPYGMD